MRKGLALPAPSTCPSSPPTFGSSWGCSQGALCLGHHPPELGTVRPAGGCAVPEQRPASSSAVPAHSRFGHGCRQRLQARAEHQQLPAGSDAQRELPALALGLPGAAATRAASSLARAEAGCAVSRAQGWFYPSQPCSGLGCCALWSLGFGKGEPRGWDPGGSTHLAPPQRTGTPLP